MSKEKKHSHEEEELKECKCGENCECDENCDCEHGKCDCGCEHEGCTCGEECHCHDGDRCSDECTCENVSREEEYLNLARQIQADFDNYRRRSNEQVKNSYEKGQASVIEVFLPCLDTFKDAKKMITDENVLKGVEMVEEKINSALSELGVKKISSIGEKYNPHFHNVIAVLKNEDKENDIILDEYQAGYIYNDKVIRYAKVIVNKKED